MREVFHSRGTRPVEIERLKMWLRGAAIEWAVDLSIQEEMPSGPEEVLEGRFEMREIVSLSEHRREEGQEGGIGKGGTGGRGGEARLKQEEKKELRHWALSEFDSAGEPFVSSVGMEEDDLRRDLTKDQNLGGDRERE